MWKKVLTITCKYFDQRKHREDFYKSLLVQALCCLSLPSRIGKKKSTTFYSLSGLQEKNWTKAKKIGSWSKLQSSKHEPEQKLRTKERPTVCDKGWPCNLGKRHVFYLLWRRRNRWSIPWSTGGGIASTTRGAEFHCCNRHCFRCNSSMSKKHSTSAFFPGFRTSEAPTITHDALAAFTSWIKLLLFGSAPRFSSKNLLACFIVLKRPDGFIRKVCAKLVVGVLSPKCQDQPFLGEKGCWRPKWLWSTCLCNFGNDWVLGYSKKMVLTKVQFTNAVNILLDTDRSNYSEDCNWV